MGLHALLSTVVGLALVGFLVWMVVTYIPMPDVVKTAILVLVAVVIILWLLQAVVGDAMIFGPLRR